MCLDMRSDMCLDMCLDIRLYMRLDMCLDMRLYMRLDMRLDLRGGTACQERPNPATSDSLVITDSILVIASPKANWVGAGHATEDPMMWSRLVNDSEEKIFLEALQAARERAIPCVQTCV